MRKIPTLFKRDPQDMRKVLPEVTPGCEWVLAGEGAPTRKYDGTCCYLSRDSGWYARREVKPGKQVPEDFVAVETDEATGKTVGWEPMSQSAFAKWHQQALNPAPHRAVERTYELCGPKVNGNPEGFKEHVLIAHEDAERLVTQARDFESLRAYLLSVPYEGIVWHHPDGRMAKLKRRDFPPAFQAMVNA